MMQGVNKNLESENMWAGTSTNIGDYAQACLSGLFAYQATVYTYFISHKLWSIDCWRLVFISRLVEMSENQKKDGLI